MATADENLMDWLRDAHAMEEQAEKMLTATAGRLKNYPEFKARVEKHIDETRQQAALVKGCIERRGGKTSTMKDVAGKATAMAQGLSGLFVSDEVVKSALASYTFEHMEIASYEILMAAADAVGDAQTRKVCESILVEERAMAQWLKERIPGIVQTFLSLAQTPSATAKH
jgi:ferritin-like metal-binding protein YciE